MSHLSGQDITSTADSAAITDTSAAGGPTVKDSFDSVQAEIDALGSDPIPQARVAAIPVLVADDAAAAILTTTNAIYLEGTTLLADKEIADTSSYNGQAVHITLAAAVLGSYTRPVSGGTLTFTAAGDSAVIVRYSVGVWRAFGLTGAAAIIP
jgi:hypothetical protein